MQKSLNIRTWILRLALGLTLFIPIYFAFAALGSKFGLWDWRFGFKLMTGYGPNLLKFAVGVGVLSLILAFALKPRKGLVVSAIAMVLPIAFLAYGQSVRSKARSVPPIHDISTDTQDPPVFTTTIIELRGDSSNPLNYIGKKVGKTDKLVSVEQVKAYPNIRTIESTMSTTESFDKALRVVKSLGWDVHTQSPSLGIIEATDTTSWFGFKDDVVIRIRASEAEGSLIDLRSVSRVGGSDIGANAARIGKFTEKFNS